MRMRNSEFQTLDIEQLKTDTTDIEDRAEYYDKYVVDRKSNDYE